MKIALVHDHLAQDGGAEKVLKALADLYPDALIYTLLYEKKNADKYFKDRHIETSIIQRLPGGIKHYQWYMPFMPMAVEFFDLSGFNVVISDASAFAKGVITSANTLHICYCHTPTRYLWDYTHQYIFELKYNKYFKKVISLLLNYIRVWDKAAADRVDIFIANSRTVKRRINKYYRRDSRVIYPPVAVDNFKISEGAKDYYLIGGRLAPYKRIDIVIEAFMQLGLKLKIFGDGIDMKRLQKIALGYSNIEFLGRVNDEEQANLYSNCLAFINPQEEDFGITMVEAMASGRPVIAFRRGGATEIIKEGETGEFFDYQTATDIMEAIKNFKVEEYNPLEIKKLSEQYSANKFKEEIRNFVNSHWQEFLK
jgi:glycosyltransferase involved in cell wall biosynthesis